MNVTNNTINNLPNRLVQVTYKGRDLMENMNVTIDVDFCPDKNLRWKFGFWLAELGLRLAGMDVTIQIWKGKN